MLKKYLATYRSSSHRREAQPMHELKILNVQSLPSALAKAKTYRFLGEPDEAESICLDILAVEPNHQDALIQLLLSLTDKFSHGDLPDSYGRAREIVEKLDDTYCKYYYIGIIFEKRAKSHLKKGGPGAVESSYQWFVKAMAAFEKALSDCDPDNQDAILRWNSCARLLNNHPEIRPNEDNNANLLLDPFETPH